MPNPFKIADTVSEAAFNMAVSAAKGAVGEFKRHPISTPMVVAGGVLALLELDGYVRRLERRDFDRAYRAEQLARQNLLQEQVTVTLPEASLDE